MTELALVQEDDWAPRFLEAYASKTAYGNISKAAKQCGIHLRTVQARLTNDTDFRAMIVDADLQLDEALEYVAYDHATNGTTRPLIQHGEIITTVQEFDHKLLQFLLERRMPAKYHLPTRIEHTNPNTPGAFTFQMGETPLELPSEAEEG